MMRLDPSEAFTSADELAYYGMREIAADDSYTAERQLTDNRYLDLCEMLDPPSTLYRVTFSDGTIRHWQASLIRRRLSRKPVYIVGIEPSKLESKGESLEQHIEGECHPYA